MCVSAVTISVYIVFLPPGTYVSDILICPKNLFSDLWYMQTFPSFSSNQRSYYKVYFVWNFGSLASAFVFHLFNNFLWPQYILCCSLLEVLEENQSRFTS